MTDHPLNLTVSVYPCEWRLWPLWQRTWERRFIYLGPLLISWHVDEAADRPEPSWPEVRRSLNKAIHDDAVRR